MGDSFWSMGTIICGSLSALAWFIAAVVPPSHTKSYFGRTPDHIVRRQKIGAYGNALGALFAAGAMLCQVALSWPG